MCKKNNNDLIDVLARMISDEQKEEYKNIDDKIDMVKFVAGYLEESIGDDGVEITTHINKPFKGMGFISVIGNEITFMSPEVLANCASVSSNVDIYPLTNGKVKIDFTFHGLAKKIK